LDFKLFIDALLSGTPIAILAALVGIIWQGIYTLSRDKTNARQIDRARKLEKHKFRLETTRGSEQLANNITLKLLDVKLSEYEKVWALVSSVSHSNKRAGNITPENTKNIARKVQEWRYSKGGLVADDSTRHVAHYFQRALWEYDGSEYAYARVRESRNLLRNALRADMGLDQLQKVIDDLNKLKDMFDSSKQETD